MVFCSGVQKKFIYILAAFVQQISLNRTLLILKEKGIYLLASLKNKPDHDTFLKGDLKLNLAFCSGKNEGEDFSVEWRIFFF